MATQTVVNQNGLKTGSLSLLMHLFQNPFWFTNPVHSVSLSAIQHTLSEVLWMNNHGMFSQQKGESEVLMSQFESVNDYISFMKAHPNMTCPIKHTLDIIGREVEAFYRAPAVWILNNCVSASCRRIFRELRIQFSPDVSGIWRKTALFFVISSMKFRPMWSILSPRRPNTFKCTAGHCRLGNGELKAKNRKENHTDL